MNDLETRLRDDLRAAAEDVRVSPDAWQQNQGRLGTDARRRGRMLQVAVGAVAAGVAAVVVVAVVPEWDDAERQQPVTGATNATSLATGVKVDEQQISATRRAELVMSLSLTREGDESSRNVCAETMLFEGRSSIGAGTGVSCKSAERGAEHESVAIDYLNASEWRGGRSLFGAVDERVATLTVYYSGGDLPDPGAMLDLRSLTDGYRVFGLIDPDENTPKPHRLVARDRDGGVLQALDLVDRFGEDWLPQRTACGSELPEQDGIPVYGQPSGPIAIWLGTTDARVAIRHSFDDVSEICNEKLRSTAIVGGYAGQSGQGDKRGTIAVIVAPEVAYIRLYGTDMAEIPFKPRPAEGSMWRVVLEFVGSPEVAERVRVVAYDDQNQPLDERVGSALNPSAG